MIQSIHVGNFKAFSAIQEIPIRPLTLIYGPNSAGKSSIIQSLILGREAELSAKLDIYTTEIGGTAIDLGGFRQYVHQGDVRRRITWGVEIASATIIDKYKNLSENFSSVQTIKVILTIGISLDDAGHALPNSEPSVIRYEISGDKDQILQFNREPDGTLRLTNLNFQHPFIRNFFNIYDSNQFDADLYDLNDEIEYFNNLIFGLIAKITKFVPEGLKFHPSARNQSHELEEIKTGTESDYIFIKFLSELVAVLSSVIRNEFDNLQYLGPLRSFPSRHIAFSDHGDSNWYSGGGFAWDVVRKDFEVRSKVNDWLGSKVLKTPYELRIKQSVNFDEIYDFMNEVEELLFNNSDTSDSDDFDTFFKELDTFFSVLRAKDQFLNFLKRKGIEPIPDLVLVDRNSDTTVSHRDVGIGISQVLPVLVMAYASKNSLIAMEQPEIHLHPALQAELGDVFIDSAKRGNGNRFLLETHSEHLLLRIMKRMRQTKEGSLPTNLLPLTADDVMILYVDPVEGNSIVREMPLNDHGELMKAWPGGFFEEGFREMFE